MYSTPPTGSRVNYFVKKEPSEAAQAASRDLGWSDALRGGQQVGRGLRPLSTNHRGDSWWGRELAKDIVSFANEIGGTVLYKVPRRVANAVQHLFQSGHNELSDIGLTSFSD